MKKKIIRNTFLLLLIPICITLIVYFTHRTKNVFYDPVNYTIKDNKPIEEKEAVRYYGDDDLNRFNGLMNTINNNYSIIMFSSCGLVLLFGLFYSYIYKTKKW